MQSTDPNAMAAVNVDDEYNPRLRVANSAAIFERWKAMAGDTRASRRHHPDLRYGDAAAETLDFFPASEASAPLLVFIHGGYWRAFDKADFSWIAPSYVDAGASVAVVNYGLAPATPIEEIARQVERACAWLHREAPALGVDRGRIVCAGHSAGAHLTATMLTTEWPQLQPRLPATLLAGAVCFSGIYDLRPLVDAEFLKADLQLDAQRAQRLSPAFRSLSGPTPCVVAVGERESSEFRRQTRLLAEAWETTVRDAFELPGEDHFSICEKFVTPGNRLFEATCALLRA